jgi:hypothetical protein
MALHANQVIRFKSYGIRLNFISSMSKVARNDPAPPRPGMSWRKLVSCIIKELSRVPLWVVLEIQNPGR